MTLLITLLGLTVSAVAFVVATATRAARAGDHRCGECRLPAQCARCAAAQRGEDRGGHQVCACGATSAHLFGAELLAWRAEHHGERLPAPVEVGPEAEGADGAAVGPPRRTTRVEAAAEAAERARQTLADELDETQRRRINRERRNPDPLTPQLLREAEQLGVRPEPQPGAEVEAPPAAPPT